MDRYTRLACLQVDPIKYDEICTLEWRRIAFSSPGLRCGYAAICDCRVWRFALPEWAVNDDEVRRILKTPLELGYDTQ